MPLLWGMPSSAQTSPGQRAVALLVERFWGAGLLLTALWLLLFHQLQVEWSVNPQYSYGWLVPFLGAYLLVRRWEDRPETSASAIHRKGLLLALGTLAAFLLLPGRLVQEANPDWRLVSWWLAFCVLSLTLIGLYWAGGLSWLRHFSFPFLFLLLSVPWPTVPEQAVIQQMMQSVTTVTVEALNWCGIFALQRGNLIELPGGVVGIDEACSGVRSLQSTLMAALFIGELSRLGLFSRAVLLVTGLILAFLLNCVRAFSLAIFYTRGGSETLDQWHDPAGYAILLISFGLLLFISKKLSGTESEPPATVPAKSSPVLFPGWLLATLALWLLFCEVGTELWYRSHEQNREDSRPWSLSWPEESDTFKRHEIPEKVQSILRYNEGTRGVFRNADGTVWNFFELIWYPGRVSAQLAGSHTPEICLPASGAAPVGEKNRELWDIGGILLTVESYTFRLNSTLWEVFHISWENRPPRQKDYPAANFYAYSSKFQAVWNGERNLGQKVIQVAAFGYENRESAQSALKEYLKKSIQPE